MSACKYEWMDDAGPAWRKRQQDELLKLGVRASSSDIWKMTVDKVLIPNDVSLKNLFKKKLTLRRR